jgi:signal transduction histidine kinase
MLPVGADCFENRTITIVRLWIHNDRLRAGGRRDCVDRRVLVGRIMELADSMRLLPIGKVNENAPGIELNLSPEVPLCKSDPQTLRQVFINLIKNAHEACGSEGMLHIATEYTPPSISVTFKDSGKGLPPEILPRIFEPFVSTKANGMGLGLAICRRLIDLNGGTIEATNENGGACFTIYLPTGDGFPPPA